MYVLTILLLLLVSLTSMAFFFFKKNAIGIVATTAATIITMIAVAVMWERQSVSFETAAQILYYQYGGSDWIDDSSIDCKVYMHYGALNLIIFHEINRLPKEGVCMYRNADWSAVTSRILEDRLEKPKDIMFIGHGGKDGNTVRFGEVLTYEDLMLLANPKAGKLGVLSCRGRWFSPNATKNTIKPYLEHGLWVWGEDGKTIGADLRRQVKAFFEKP